MAKILYGVSGEGAGHSTRSLEAIRFLESQGHEVRVLTYGKGVDNLKDQCTIQEVPGLHIAYRNNKVSNMATLMENVMKAPKSASIFNAALKVVREFQPDICITDFEPVTTYLSHMLRKPLISISNQQIITKSKVKIPPKHAKDYMTATMIIKMLVSGEKKTIIPTFIEPKELSKDTILIPPIVRQEVRDLKVSDGGNYVLVYLTSEFKNIANLLKDVNYNFIIYGLEKEGRDGNITYKKRNPQEFIEDLANARALLSTAGFSSLSEALYLGKPCLAMPTRGQFEQVFNAMTLEECGFGKWWPRLSKERIEAFLFNVPTYKKNIAEKYKKSDGSEFFEVLTRVIKETKV